MRATDHGAVGKSSAATGTCLESILVAATGLYGDRANLDETSVLTAARPTEASRRTGRKDASLLTAGRPTEGSRLTGRKEGFKAAAATPLDTGSGLLGRAAPAVYVDAGVAEPLGLVAPPELLTARTGGVLTGTVAL